MRLVTWNLNKRTPRCIDLLHQLSADILVLQEVHHDHLGVASGDAYRERWRQAPSGKTFGVVVRAGLYLSDIDETPLPWCVPVKVQGDGLEFHLISMWALSRSAGIPAYSAQLAATIDRYARPDLGPLVIAGDMNASAHQGTAKAHLANIAKLRERGFESAYHWSHGHADADEVPTTLRWANQPTTAFHCDFVFIPPQWQLKGTSVSLGDPEVIFGGGLSDHLPVIVDVPLGR